MTDPIYDLWQANADVSGVDQPEGPTRDEAVAIYTEVMAAHDCQTLGDMAEHFARAVLARWGNTSSPTKPMTDFRSLCAELYAIFEKYDDESNLAGIYHDLKADGNNILDRVHVALAQPESQIPKNCWLDDEPDLYPSPCVFDDPDERIDDCVYALQLRAAGKAKTQCKYYRQCDQLDPQSTQEGDAS